MTDYLTKLRHFSESTCGGIAQYAIERQTGFRNRELLAPFSFTELKSTMLIHQMLVHGPGLFHILAFLV